MIAWVKEMSLERTSGKVVPLIDGVPALERERTTVTSVPRLEVVEGSEISAGIFHTLGLSTCSIL